MKTKLNIILIDDDESNNLMCKIMLRHVLGKDIHISAHTDALLAIQEIKEFCKAANENEKLMVLLDINMPFNSGWEVLEMLGKCENYVKDRTTISMVSSSIDDFDKIRAKEHPMVFSYIEKPLTRDKIENMLPYSVE